jgi:dihydrofolate reductase
MVPIRSPSSREPERRYGLGKVIVIEHLTLDGVMQDPAMQEVMGAHMAGAWSLLTGRTTYERLADYWPKQEPNPFTEALNRAQKYVASTTLTEPLPWQNFTLLKGDVADAVDELKRELDENLVVFGSGVLVRSLMPRDLVDELVLLIHPLVLGSGFGCSRKPARVLPPSS